MFTLEESAHLGFMLRAVGWMILAAAIGATLLGAVHWAHLHHYPLLHRH